MPRLDRSRVFRRLGRRGLVLALIGGIWVVSGTDQMFAPTDRFSAPGPGGALQFMDLPTTGVLWAVAGLVAFTVGIAHHRDQPSVWEVWGFNALITPPATAVFFFAWSALLHVLGPDGNARAVPGLLTNAVVVALMLIVAGWKEDPVPPPLPRRPRRGDPR